MVFVLRGLRRSHYAIKEIRAASHTSHIRIVTFSTWRRIRYERIQHDEVFKTSRFTSIGEASCQNLC